MNTPTETLIKALRILANDIQSDDGVANATIGEAADRLEQQEERIKRLEEAEKPKLKGRRCISSEVQNAIAELPDNISNHSASRRFGVSITTINKYRQSQRKSQ